MNKARSGIAGVGLSQPRQILTHEVTTACVAMFPRCRSVSECATLAAPLPRQTPGSVNDAEFNFEDCNCLEEIWLTKNLMHAA